MPEQNKYIGVANMDDEGTITLLLKAEHESGVAGHAQFMFPKGHERYHEILDHVGGLEPGDEKLVPPWPDEA